MTIIVYGTPAPQGSKSFKGHAKNGRAILAESSKAVKPWREAVKWAAIEEMSRPDHLPDRPMLRGPVSVDIEFTLPKPVSAPKKRWTAPDKKPDIDKLCRSTLDAIVQAGVIEDDSRVVWLRAYKNFPAAVPGKLNVPGAVIHVRRVTENGLE